MDSHSHTSQIRSTDIIIAVVGTTGSGKSTFISKCTGQEVEIEHGLSPCTTLVEPFTFERNGLTVHLIDTPGFQGTTNSDALLLEDIADCLNHAYISGNRINGIVYLHPISSTRLQGSAIRGLQIIQKICGQDATPLILLGSTMWDKEDIEIAEGREDELTSNNHFWGSMIEHGSKTFRFYNDQASALIACDYIIERRQKMVLALQKQMVDEQKTLSETDAGMELEKEIMHIKQTCRSMIEEAREEAQHSAQMNNEQLVMELTMAQQLLQLQLDASERVLDTIHGNMEALHIRSEHTIRQELRRMRGDEEREDVLLSERMSELDRLEQRLEDLIDKLEDKDDTKSSDHRPEYKSSDRFNISSPLNDEIQDISEKRLACEKEIKIYKSRRVFRCHRIDTCLNRLGVGAGVVGAAFQVAAFGVAMAACNVM